MEDMMTKTDRRLKKFTFAAATVLIIAVIFNVAIIGLNAPAVTGDLNSSASAQSATDKLSVSDLNIDSLREQYLKQTAVSNQTAEFDGKRWVIVALDGDTLYEKFEKGTRYNEFDKYAASVEGKKALANIEAQQQKFLKKLDSHGIDYDFKYSYSALNNGVAIKVNAEAYNAIGKMSGVSGVYYSENYAEPTVAVTNNANVYTTGIYNSKDLDYKGEGMVVAILDTGLDATHEAFQTMPNPANEGLWTKEYVAEKMSQTGFKAAATVDDVYYNSKVPFAYDYADDDPVVFPAYSSHGTHVAGIVAGSSDYVVNENGPGTEDDETFVGVAPEAQLVICKVFTDKLESDALGGADSIDILAAVNDCTLLGVDVINMSLGSSAGFADERSDTYTNEVYNKVREAGISLVVAASNDYSSGYGGGHGTNLASNPDSGTVGSPSTYESALSVASINGQKAPYLIAQYNNRQDVAFFTHSSDEFSVEYKFVEQLYEKSGAAAGTDLKFKLVRIDGVGRATNYTAFVKKALNHNNAVAEGYAGTIALVKRGDTTFEEKVKEAMKAGADACIIYNNVSGVIRMSLGGINNPIPTVSITMDAGEAIVASMRSENSNNIVSDVIINSNLVAGPFMSDFSSWGPMPNLELKPEITAHGGEITSAVPGGYDKYSGTSMAAPNMSGAVSLLRQYLKKANPALTGTELNARVNQVLMSTATIANNEFGNPYSPRKQGAGLAGIADAISAEGYLTVLDSVGEVRDKTKIELFDDKNKVGVYNLDFIINNITDKDQTYNPIVYVMTETMASDGKTVAEKAYMLNDMCDIEYFVGPDANSLEAHNGTVSVPANGKLSVRVKITLGRAARNYLDKNFKNGMYVEGFVSLKATGDTKVTLGLPYLGFYGDWTAAPLFDYDTYEIAESDKNETEEEKKLKASAAATRIIGKYYQEKYILEMGAYVYTQAEEDVKIYPDKEKIALSMFDDSSGHAIYELYMVYAGLLRGAAYMNITITDAYTGELVYSQRKENVSKSFAAGGSNRGSAIMLDLNPYSWNMLNNATYNVSLKGELDYPGGENPERNSFDFKFTVDYEAPRILDYRVRFEPWTDKNVVKYRIYMDFDVYDNQDVMALLPCYVDSSGHESVIRLLTEYPVAVSGQKGEKSTVSIEVTDYYDEYVKTGKMYVSVEDYAMNSTLYEINVGNDLFEEGVKEYPDSVEFGTSDILTKDERPSVDAYNNEYYTYNLAAQPNTLYTLDTIMHPADTLIQTLSWQQMGSAKVKDNQIYTAGSGKTTLILKDDTGKVYAKVIVNVEGKFDAVAPNVDSITLGTVLNGSGYAVALNKSETLEMKPEQSVKIEVKPTPWYCNKPAVIWETSNSEVVEVDNLGNVRAKRKGTAFVSVTVKDNARLKKTIQIIVDDPYYVNNYTLYDYYGSGVVEIPNNKNIMYLDQDCFRYNTKIETVILPTSLTEIPEFAFEGCTNLKTIVIPGQCTTVKPYAFKDCTSLTTVELGKFVDADHNEVGEKYYGSITFGAGAFMNCTSLKTFVNPERITTLYYGAFEGCTSLESIDISELRVAGARVFTGCTNLKEVTTSKDTIIGPYMFENCTSLTSFECKGGNIQQYAFLGCEKLEDVSFTNDFVNIGTGAFSGTKVSSVTLPNGKVYIAANAFSDCKSLATVKLSSKTELSFEGLTPFTGCDAFNAYAIVGENTNYDVEDGVLYSEHKAALVAVPYAKASVTLPGTVTEIAPSAFAGSKVQSLDASASGITALGAYAFAGSALETVKLPAGLTAIPEGLFYNCKSLKTVESEDAGAVKTIGDHAFRGCSSVASLPFNEVTKIGASAFLQSGLTAVPGAATVTEIGDYAFEGNIALVSIDLPVLRKVGTRAFAQIKTLTTVSLGPIEKDGMGSGVFEDSAAITSAAFADGTYEIGADAFYSAKPNNKAFSVSLPNSVKKIGAYAFANQNALTTVNLSGVESVGDCAFAFCGQFTADLSNLKEIGAMAFCSTALTSVSLDKAEIIDSYAFADVETLTSVTLKVAKVIGAYAFANTRLTTVVLPKTMNSRTYDFEWNVYDEKHRVTEVKHRNELAYGAGAFSDIPTLESIEVEEGSEVFVSIDGVLYSKLYDLRQLADGEPADDVLEVEVGEGAYKYTFRFAKTFKGYALEQYPANRNGAKYAVENKTVSISDSAFEKVRVLNEIEFPYTVKFIGAYAFFNCSVGNYVFNSVNAPTLGASYVSAEEGKENDPFGFAQNWFDRGTNVYAAYKTEFYANFMGYSVDANPELNGVNFNLEMTIPKNGKGYDNVWKRFFSTINLTADLMPDDVTSEAIIAIAALPSPEAIANIATLDGINAKGGAGELARNARIAYNKIVDAEQRGIAAESFEDLLAVEKALRDAKAKFGAPVRIAKLDVVSQPNKLDYNIGDRFDPTGMACKAIYSDGSEVELSGGNYSISPEIITAPTNPALVDRKILEILITYADGEDNVTATILVNVKGTSSEPVEPSVEPENKGLTVGAIVAISVVIPVVVLAAAAVAVVLVLKKKKGSKNANASDDKSEKAENASEQSAENGENAEENLAADSEEYGAQDVEKAESESDNAENGNGQEADNAEAVGNTAESDSETAENDENGEN